MIIVKLHEVAHKGVQFDPKRDVLIEWLKVQGFWSWQLGIMIFLNGGYIPNKEVAKIQQAYTVPLSKAERIILSDIKKDDRGLLIKRFGIPERLVKFGLARESKGKLKATNAAFDNRILYLVDKTLLKS